jgi:hypothetical protein
MRTNLTNQPLFEVLDLGLLSVPIDSFDKFFADADGL